MADNINGYYMELDGEKCNSSENGEFLNFVFEHNIYENNNLEIIFRLTDNNKINIFTDSGDLSKFINNITFQRENNNNLLIYNQNNVLIYNNSENSNRKYYKVIFNNYIENNLYNFSVYKLIPSNTPLKWEYTNIFNSVTYNNTADSISELILNYNIYNQTFGIGQIKLNTIYESIPDFYLYSDFNNSFIFNTIGTKYLYLYITDNVHKPNTYYKEFINFNILDSSECFTTQEININNADLFYENPETLIEYWTNFLYIVRMPYRILRDFNILNMGLLAIKIFFLIGLFELFSELNKNGIGNSLKITMMTATFVSFWFWIMKLFETVWFIVIVFGFAFFIAKDLTKSGQENIE